MRIILIFLIILNIATIANTNPKRSLGLKIGPHISTIRYIVKSDDENSHTFDYQTTPTVSFFFDLPQNNTIVHSFALDYYQNCGKEDITFSVPFFAYSTTRSLSLQYLGLRYNFKATVDIERLTPYFSAGIAFDFLVDFGKEGYDEGFYHIEKNDIDHFSGRAILCGGLEYNLDKIALLIEYGFAYNLIPFYKWENSSETVKYSYTSLAHTLNLGIKVPF